MEEALTVGRAPSVPVRAEGAGPAVAVLPVAATAEPQRIAVGRDRHPVVVVDGFLEDPAAVRAEALRSRFRDAVSSYPGRLAPTRWCGPSLVAALAELAKVPHDASATTNYSLLTRRGDELPPAQRVPHWDSADLAGVVFLSPPHRCRGGTAFYRHRETGLEQAPLEVGLPLGLRLARCGIRSAGALQRRLSEPDPALKGFIGGSTPLWERIGRVEMRWNRLVLYPGRIFHSGEVRDGDFGEAPGERRLTLNFFLRFRDARQAPFGRWS